MDEWHNSTNQKRNMSEGGLGGSRKSIGGSVGNLGHTVECIGELQDLDILGIIFGPHDEIVSASSVNSFVLAFLVRTPSKIR